MSEIVCRLRAEQYIPFRFILHDRNICISAVIQDHIDDHFRWFSKSCLRLRTQNSAYSTAIQFVTRAQKDARIEAIVFMKECTFCLHTCAVYRRQSASLAILLPVSAEETLHFLPLLFTLTVYRLYGSRTPYRFVAPYSRRIETFLLVPLPRTAFQQ